ncbi:mechanosensitive ion channel [Candidatus Pacearchaeota archaeon]|nr:mechanosensitive ion channel [Candidatus Pacearchaeota archaeon]MBD3282855.1 mechanosensitive ion channel [Candidatus Pacearchaeota archaeon]
MALLDIINYLAVILSNLKSVINSNIYTKLSFNTIAIIILAFATKFLLSVFFNRSLKRIEKKKSIEDKRTRKTRIEFLRNITTTIIFLLAITFILLPIPGFKTFSYSILAGAGIAAIIIGFAAQKTLANIFSGISVALYSPFRIGDRLKIGEEFGDVEEINLRHTIIRTWDNRRIIIPNSIISEREIVNYSLKEERLLWSVNMGISYDSDIEKAKKIMLKLAKKHPNVIMPEIKDEDGNIEKKQPVVRVTECKDFSINLKLFFWVEKPGKAWVTGFDLIEQIKKEFDKQGIEIPFPYRTIVYKKDLDRKKR